MNTDEIYHKLTQHTNSMSFNPPATELYISAFENDNSVQLPKSFRELLKFFNGGKIYSPGTIIYGIDSEDVDSFKYITKANKTALKIPENYYIIAKLNYGDYICLNFLPPYDVIQWDNTNKRKYLSWTSLELWLESIIDFGYIPKEEIINTSNYPNIPSHSSTVIPKRRMSLPIILSIVPVIVICGFIVYGKVKNTTEQHGVKSDTSHSSESSLDEKNSSVTNAIALHTTTINSGIVNEVINSNATLTTVADEEENADYKHGTVNTVKDPLNVRKQPSVDSEKIGSVQKGTTVTIIGDTGEWYEIIYDDQIGYVSKLYVVLENETRLEVAVTGVVITKDDPLNVREQPNINSKILGTVPKGETVSIINDDGEWYEIQYGSGTGYVSKKYVSLR